jgi:RNA polymerase-binding transcription factor DksA
MTHDKNFAAASAALDRREVDLRREVAAAQAALADFDAGRERGDLKDVADLAATTAVDDAQLARDLAELHDIASARQRIAEGFYGQCVDCGAAIAAARLAAQPATGRCFGCQQAAEQVAAHGLRLPTPR